MMGPDASSCLDLDECVIEPDVSPAENINSDNDFIINGSISNYTLIVILKNISGLQEWKVYQFTWII